MENLDLFQQLFLIKPVKGENINKNCFSPQNEPHTAKICFSVVLKHFRGNSLKTSHFSPESDYLRKKLRNTQKYYFSHKFGKEKSQWKIWIWCKQRFLFKAIKWDNY